MTPPDEPPAAPGVGDRLAQFRLRRELGRGGAGVVYEAEDTLLHRPVAVKVLQFDADDAEGRRVLREARAVARLDHPHVVRIHHIGKWTNGFYLVLELMPGGSLDAHVRGGRPLAWAAATAAIADACRGLAAAHDAGLVHRDVKPANLLTDKGGRVKVSDFGLARAVEGADPGVSHGHPGKLTFAGSMRSVAAGTPRYMSPEQCRGEPADERSDVYSLGVTYYALLTGRPPFDAPTPTQLMFAHCTTPMPDPRARVPDLPAEIAAVIRRATAKNPADRYSSAADMLDALLPNAPTPLPTATPTSVYTPLALPVLPPPPPPNPVALPAPVPPDTTRRFAGEDTVEDEEDDRPVVRRRSQPNRRQWVTAAVVAGVMLPLAAVGVAVWWVWLRESTLSSGSTAGGPTRGTGGPSGNTGGGPTRDTGGPTRDTGGGTKGTTNVLPPKPPVPGQSFDPVLPADGVTLRVGKTAVVAFSETSPLFAAGGEGSGATIWDVTNGKLVRQLDWGDVKALAFGWKVEGNLRGTTLQGGGGPRGPLWWTEANGRDGGYFKDTKWEESWGILGAAAVQIGPPAGPEGERVVREAFGYCANNLSGNTRCYSTPPSGQTCSIGENEGRSGVRLLRYAPATTDATIAIVRFNGGVHLWNSDTGKQVAQVVPGPGNKPDKAADVAFHPDGTRLAVATGDRVRFWNRRTEAFDAQTDAVDGKQVTAVAYSPDGKTLAAGDSAGAVRLYENGGPTPTRVLAGQGAEVCSLAFRPSGPLWLACGSADGTVRLWDVAKLPR